MPTAEATTAEEALDDATAADEAMPTAEATTLEEALDDATVLDEATPTDEATTVEEALGVGVGAAQRGAASLSFPTAQVEASSVYSSK